MVLYYEPYHERLQKEHLFHFSNSTLVYLRCINNVWYNIIHGKITNGGGMCIILLNQSTLLVTLLLLLVEGKDGNISKCILLLYTLLNAMMLSVTVMMLLSHVIFFWNFKRNLDDHVVVGCLYIWWLYGDYEEVGNPQWISN